MKKNLTQFIVYLLFVPIGFTNSCKKDKAIVSVGTKSSFTEEFEEMYTIENKGWYRQTSPTSTSALWDQGRSEFDKFGGWYGFTAYSYKNNIDEFAYSAVTEALPSFSISSWLITPVLAVKNGDKISFYTRADSVGSYVARMQVLMNLSTSTNTGIGTLSTGSFTTTLFDINPTQVVDGYPKTWKKFEYTFSGLSGVTDTRIAFRHYLKDASSAKGIGIDLFKFEVN